MQLYEVTTIDGGKIVVENLDKTPGGVLDVARTSGRIVGNEVFAHPGRDPQEPDRNPVSRHYDDQAEDLDRGPIARRRKPVLDLMKSAPGRGLRWRQAAHAWRCASMC
jgi:hypothetical protein